MRTLIVYTQQDPDGRRAFQSLCLASGSDLFCSYVCTIRRINPNTHLGQGHVATLKALIQQYQIKQLLFDCDLKPTVQRNLEQAWCVHVSDRSEVILDIFARHARTYEGKLQVEWAQLQRLSTRLIRGWTHLERQKGGIGLRGPGETQLETDRRLIQKRIEQINRKLKKIVRSRSQNRQARAKHATPVAALIGYTNVGKSTLFNRLTQSNVYAADQPFATLDPTVRKVKQYPHHFILMDTVGFIDDLPKELLAGFRATLEEIKYADLLIHVLDAQSGLKGLDQEHIASVEHTLNTIDALHIPRIYFYNKVDDICAQKQPPEKGLTHRGMPCIWGSAEQGLGCEPLLQTISEIFEKNKA